MNRTEAIKKLKQALDEIPELKKLQCDNEEFKEWQRNVTTIAKYALGSDDYKTLTSPKLVTIHLRDEWPNNVYQEEYLKELSGYERDLKSIIQKYEILGIGTDSEIISKKRSITEGKGNYEENKVGAINLKEKPFEQAIELELKTTPETLCSVIKTVASEFKWGKLHYRAAVDSKGTTSSFRKILIIAANIVGSSIENEDAIGIVTLQKLGENDKTLLRIPPRNQWHINIEPETLAVGGDPTCNSSHISKTEFCLFFSESYFTHFLEKLHSEFQRLGFKETKSQKAWQRFKEALEIWNKMKL